MSCVDTIEHTAAVTTSGSRVFGQSFVVTWTPATTSAQLTVTITGGSDPLTSNTFVPGNAMQVVSASDGTYSVAGKLITVFGAQGTTGTLLSQNLEFTAPNGGTTSFSGAIGSW